MTKRLIELKFSNKKTRPRKAKLREWALAVKGRDHGSALAFSSYVGAVAIASDWNDRYGGDWHVVRVIEVPKRKGVKR